MVYKPQIVAWHSMKTRDFSRETFKHCSCSLFVLTVIMTMVSVATMKVLLSLAHLNSSQNVIHLIVLTFGNSKNAGFREYYLFLEFLLYLLSCCISYRLRSFLPLQWRTTNFKPKSESMFFFLLAIVSTFWSNVCDVLFSLKIKSDRRTNVVTSYRMINDLKITNQVMWATRVRTRMLFTSSYVHIMLQQNEHM